MGGWAVVDGAMWVGGLRMCEEGRLGMQCGWGWTEWVGGVGVDGVGGWGGGGRSGLGVDGMGGWGGRNGWVGWG